MPTTATKTVKPSGGDYTSLSAWEAGQQGDLTVSDTIQQAECYAMNDATQVVINGWTTDATRYLRIYTPSSERHDGKWNTTKYRMDGAFDWTGAIQLLVNDVRIEGVQCRNTSTNNPAGILIGAVGNDLRVSSSVLNACGDGISGTDATGTLRLWNNLILPSTNRYGLYWFNSAAGSAMYAYNNSIIVSSATSNPALYVQNCSDLKLRNNLVQSPYTNYNLVSNTQVTQANLSGDATSPDAAFRNLTVSFQNAGSGDYHLAASDTSALDAGADLSADANLAFSTDIDGQTRSGSWDIGADEYVASGSTVTWVGYIG